MLALGAALGAFAAIISEALATLLGIGTPAAKATAFASSAFVASTNVLRGVVIRLAVLGNRLTWGRDILIEQREECAADIGRCMSGVEQAIHQGIMVLEVTRLKQGAYLIKDLIGFAAFDIFKRGNWHAAHNLAGVALNGLKAVNVAAVDKGD